MNRKRRKGALARDCLVWSKAFLNSMLGVALGSFYVLCTGIGVAIVVVLSQLLYRFVVEYFHLFQEPVTGILI